MKSLYIRTSAIRTSFTDRAETRREFNRDVKYLCVSMTREGNKSRMVKKAKKGVGYMERRKKEERGSLAR